MFQTFHETNIFKMDETALWCTFGIDLHFRQGKKKSETWEHFELVPPIKVKYISKFQDLLSSLLFM